MPPLKSMGSLRWSCLLLLLVCWESTQGQPDEATKQYATAWSEAQGDFIDPTDMSAPQMRQGYEGMLRAASGLPTDNPLATAGDEPPPPPQSSRWRWVSDDEVDAQTLVTRTIQAAPVVVFASRTCSYCKQIKELIQSTGVRFIHLDLETLGSKMGPVEQVLNQITGQNTVPQVFINGRWVGGYNVSQFDVSTEVVAAMQAGAFRAMIDQQRGSSPSNFHTQSPSISTLSS